MRASETDKVVRDQQKSAEYKAGNRQKGGQLQYSFSHMAPEQSHSKDRAGGSPDGVTSPQPSQADL